MSDGNSYYNFREEAVNVDILGRVNNASLPHKQGIMALFEAVINSIDAIEESGTGNGQITINVVRDGLYSKPEDREHDKIIGFDVIDNGNGFNSENYKSFNTSDSTKKITIGGKGVGRFFWLKVFDKISIESFFVENNEKFRREFDFVLDNKEPIKQNKIDRPDSKVSIQTTVSLRNIKKNYDKYIPNKSETIAQRLLEYCLTYFVVGIMPKVSIIDGEKDIDLNDLYQEFVKGNEKTELEFGDQHFVCWHFLLEAHTNLTHQVNYCAAKRVVKSTNLTSNNIPHLPNRIVSSDGEDSLVYMEYVLSPFLDENVNLQRTDFNTYKEGSLAFIGDLEWSDIESAAINEARTYLNDVTNPTREETKQTVQEFVKEAPEYKYLLDRHPNVIDKIAPGSTKQSIELELFKIEREKDIEVHEVMDEIINASDSALLDPEDEINQLYDKYLDEINESGKAALAKYVVKRRKTLEILKRYMEIDDQEGYAREKAVHDLIFPMNKTSDKIPYDKQNLWIIDEKLSFHDYLASDISFKQNQRTESTSRKRPDIIIFDLPIAVAEGEPINGVTIFEFKRPMKESGNPVTQMYSYVRELRTNNALKPNGRPVRVTETTPFYCYAVCDISDSLRLEFENLRMTKTPDGEGYFGFNPTPNLMTYVEVISYDKLLKDAMQRNRILFKKLGMIG